MSPPNFEIVDEGPQSLIIRDIGPWDKHRTVTNGAEQVVEQLRDRITGKTLLYYDSNGDLGRINVENGKFTGFEYPIAPL